MVKNESINGLNVNILHSLEDQFFDINRVPGNGTLIFPLSMSRLCAGQDPKRLYDFLCFFEEKVTEKSIDVIFVYTNGLYTHSSSASSDLRKKLNAQMFTHKQELDKLIRKHNRFTPKAIHYIPWDYILLQATNYLDLYAILSKAAATDNEFASLIKLEMRKGANKGLEGQEFIIEETIVTYLIREKYALLPSTLAEPNGWRLICYAGRCLITDAYIFNKNILPKNSINSTDWFTPLASSCMYNMERKILVDYKKINFKTLGMGSNDQNLVKSKADNSLSSIPL